MPLGFHNCKWPEELKLFRAVAYLSRLLRRRADRGERRRGRGARNAGSNKLPGGPKIAAVKSPGFGDRRGQLEDIAILTGGNVISEHLGIKLENLTLETLGSAKKVTIEKESTTIVDGAGARKDTLLRSPAGSQIDCLGVCPGEFDLAAPQ